MHVSGAVLRQAFLGVGFAAGDVSDPTMFDASFPAVVRLLPGAFNASSDDLAELVHLGLIVVPSECVVSPWTMSAWRNSGRFTGPGVLAETPAGVLLDTERTVYDLLFLLPAVVAVVGVFFRTWGIYAFSKEFSKE